ncbi:MAG: hypothetical protein M1834_000065 [Cirrosporium novae-zelandiae]|nr:MAG: hypothetical protein M1834_000065 [Cirrosporium novae-zelandiae]
MGNTTYGEDVVSATGDDSRSGSSSTGATETEKKAPWWSYIWDYDPGRSQEERLFVQRLDLGILSLLSLGYFIKNLDQTNISNAFVSGMKEDLNMYGNQLNLIDTAWTVGYVIGQIPSQVILTRIRPSVWIPTCELIWTMLTFCLAAAKTANHVIAIRFFVGLFESIFYPAAHTILGAWYKPSELGKRACVFHASSAIAGMFSGYLQAAVYTNLNGVRGLPGWKWLFHKRLAKHRMASIGRSPRSRLDRTVWKRVFSKWHVYLLTILYIDFINTGPSSSLNPLALWLKAQGYSNIIPTALYAVQLVSTLLLAVLSDALRSRPLPMTISTAGGFLASILLLLHAYPSLSIPTGLSYFAYFIYRLYVPFGPLSMSWANEICSSDAEERAIVIGVMNSVAYAFNAWVPLLSFPQKEGWQFKRGWAFAVGAFAFQFFITWVVWWMERRDRRRENRLHGDGAVLGEEVGERLEGREVVNVDVDVNVGKSKDVDIER